MNTKIHTGSATINQSALSFYAPIYGIACNTVNPGRGTVTNCYYLKEHTASRKASAKTPVPVAAMP